VIRWHNRCQQTHCLSHPILGRKHMIVTKCRHQFFLS
jgi:hypothetical protein